MEGALTGTMTIVAATTPNTYYVRIELIRFE
jgi:hypothetical protein